MTLEFPEVSLYIHFPFCSSQCHYCDYYSEDLNCFSSGSLSEYTNQLIEELEQSVKEWGIHSFPTIYLGGGTPSLFPVKDLVRLFTKIKELSETPPLECTFELNPESLTKEWLSAAQDIGVNRFSCGIQTLNEESRHLINRKGGAEKLLKSINLLKETGSALNFDLISGLPAQNGKRILDDIKLLLEFSPQHLSYYDLSIEPTTELGKKIERGVIILLDEEAREKIWESGKKFITQNGFRRYEISAYCREGFQSIHNCRYWEMKPWLGIGAGAASSLRSGQFHFKKRNNDNIEAYLSGIRGKWKQQEAVDTASEILMMGLRTCNGFDNDELRRYLSPDSWEKMHLTINSLIQNGYLAKEKNKIYPEEKGMNFHSYVTMTLFESIQ